MRPSEAQPLSAATRPVQHPDRRILAAEVRMICGGITDMTLWRWLNDPNLAFPRPIYLGRRRYWREADIVAWLDSREVAV